MNKIKLIFVMLTWGSIGLLTKNVDLSTSALTFYRAVISVPVLFAAFDVTNISLAILIYNMCPVYVMILAPIILGEKSDRMQKITIALSFVGLCLLVGEKMSGGGLFQIVDLPKVQILLVIILGVIHTGIAYTIYFSTYKHLRAAEIVSYSYFEPLFSIGLGVVFLGERLTIIQCIGGLLVLGLYCHHLEEVVFILLGNCNIRSVCKGHQ
jgi:drug/metabolite transporter (DMT)-like permease